MSGDDGSGKQIRELPAIKGEEKEIVARGQDGLLAKRRAPKGGKRETISKSRVQDGGRQYASQTPGAGIRPTEAGG